MGVLTLLEPDEASTLVGGGALALQLLDLHVASCFAQNSVGHLTELLHVLLEVFLGHVPSNIPHEERSVSRGVCRVFDAGFSFLIHLLFFLLWCLRFSCLLFVEFD